MTGAMDQTVAIDQPAVSARRRSRIWLVAIALAILLFFLLAALFPDTIGRHDPIEQSLTERFSGPSLENWFGTDELGRDIYARVIHGTRSALVVSGVAVLVSLIFGVPLGLIAGNVGGWGDDVISRSMDLLISIPGILIAMSLIAILGRNPIMVAMVLGVVSTPVVMRITRAVTLQTKELPYVLAVKSAGASAYYIAVRTILPNAYADLSTQSLLTAAHAVVVAAGLAFLGLGLPPPNPSWGAMLQTSARYTYQAWWYGVFPGLTLVLLILALQLLAIAQRGKRG